MINLNHPLVSASTTRLPILPMLLWLGLAMGLSHPSRADTHTVPLGPEWALRLKVEGQARFHESQFENAVLHCLYTANGQVGISLSGEFFGDLPGDGDLYVFLRIDTEPTLWTVDGATAQRLMDLEKEQLDREGSDTLLIIQGSVRAVKGTMSTGIPFSIIVQLSPPFRGHLSVSGVRTYVTSYHVEPYFGSSGNLNYRYPPLPHASVEIEDSVDFEFNPGTITTDDQGRARIEMLAPLGLPIDENGLVHTTVGFLIRSQGRESRVKREYSLPFASVLESSGAMVVARQGQLIEPFSIHSNDYLRPNDVIQVGNTISGSGAFVRIRYSNGKVVMLRSDNLQGMRAIVGETGKLRQVTSALSLELDNLRQEVVDNPRRFGRLVIYKTLGKLAGTLVPGGAKTKWVTATGVTHALERVMEPAYSGRSRQSVLAPGDDLEGPSLVEVDFFSDGTFLVQNAGATHRLASGNQERILPAGGAVYGGTDGQPLTDVGTRPGLGSGDPTVLGLACSPGHQSSVSSPHPTIQVQFPGAALDPVVPGSFECRLNGVSLADLAIIDPTEATLIPDARRAFRPGANQLDVSVATVSGIWAELSHVVTFEPGLPEPPSFVTTHPGSIEVAIRWSPASHPLTAGYRLYRSTAPELPGQLLNPDFLLQSGVWWDQPTDSVSYYRLVTELTDGTQGPASAPVRAELALSAPNAAAATGSVAIESHGNGLRLSWQEAADTIAWSIERAVDSGSFTPLLPGEVVARPPFFDDALDPGRFYRYRITPLNADRIAGKATVTAGMIFQEPPPPGPTGLTARFDGHHARLRWDPADSSDVVHYRVARYVSDQFVSQATAPSDSPWFDDGPLAPGSYRWRVSAVNSSGSESSNPAEIALRMPYPTSADSFAFAQLEHTVAETAGVARLALVRTGSLAGPAAVRVVTSDEGQSAAAGLDFLTTGITLLFGTGQAVQSLEVPVIARDGTQGPRSFLVSLSSVVLGGELGFPSDSSVTILDSDTSNEPVLVPVPELVAVVGKSFDFSLQARGTPVSFHATHLPAGLELDPATGRISGVPVWPTLGSMPILITTANAVGSVSGIVNITVHPHEPGTAKWTLESIEAAGEAGSQCALALDAAGRPWIPFFDNATESLRLVRHTGAAWMVETVDALDRAGHYPSIRFDTLGRPHLSYLAFGRSMVRHGLKSGESWLLQDVEVGMGYPGTAIALDTNNHPHISLMTPGTMNAVNPTLMSYDGAQWVRRVIVRSTEQAGLFNALDIDSANRPHLSYNNQTAARLQYATPGFAGWQVVAVDPSGPGLYTSIRADANQTPHISYFHHPTGQLRYARRAGSGWHLEVVDATGRAGTYSSLALDALGRPHISYRDELAAALKYAYHDGERWVIQTVDDSSDTGYSSSLALDPQGVPWIAYYDLGAKRLRLAQGSLPPQVGSLAPVEATAGQALDWQLPTSGSATAFTASGLPPELTLHPSLGKLSGTPVVPGRFPVEFQISNSGGVVIRQIEFVIQDSMSAWSQRHFTNAQLADPNLSGPDADPDLDDRSNRLEYALGTDPWVADAEPAATATVEDIFGGNYLVLTTLLPDPPPADVDYEWLGGDRIDQWSSGQTELLQESLDPVYPLRILEHRLTSPAQTQSQGYLQFRVRPR